MTKTDSYITKFRPRKLSEVVGQPQAVAEISGMLKRGKIPSTFIISGPYGTGKTSIARIIADKVNNYHGDNNPDVIESDSAEQRGIDDVRKLIAKSKYAPRNRYRVIIVDEAHKLTGDAKSALLKTTEEPPPNTIWIFVTSEPERMDKGLISRCLSIQLQLPEPRDIIPLLSMVAKKEQLKFGKKHKQVIRKIAESAYGQPRASLALLQSVANRVAGGDNPAQAIKAAMQSIDVAIERIAAKLLLCAYKGDPVATLKTLSDIKDKNHIGVVNIMLAFNGFMLNQCAGVIPYTISPLKPVVASLGRLPKLSLAINIHNALNDLRMQLFSFSANEMALCQARLSRLAVQVSKH